VYAYSVLARGEMTFEVERIRQRLVAAESASYPTREDRRLTIQTLSNMFKSLLLAKEVQQESIQHVRENHSRDAQHGSPRPTDNALPGVGVGNVLQEEVARS
jgi:hypothetical protein